MIFDALNMPSSDQVVTVTAVGEDVIDLLQARDIGEGTPLFMCFHVKQAAAAAGAATVTFEVITDDNSGLATPATLAISAAIGKAALVVGAQIYLPIPAQIGSKGERFLSVRYTIGTGPLTAGIFDAFICRNVADAKKFYPGGFTISS